MMSIRIISSKRVVFFKKYVIKQEANYNYLGGVIIGYQTSNK